MPNTLNPIFDRKLRGHLPVTQLAVSDSGDVTVALADEFKTRLYHIVRLRADGSQEEIRDFSVEKPSHTDISADGLILVAATDDDVYVFRDGGKERFFPNRRDIYSDIAISASGELFAIGSADMMVSSHAVTLARTAGNPVWTKNFPFSITCVRITPDASRILAGTEEGVSVLLDAARKTLWEMEGDDPITAVAVSNSADLCVQGTKNGALQAIAGDGDSQWWLEGAGQIAACDVDADGRRIFVARSVDESGVLEVYSGQGALMLEHPMPAEIRSVASCPSGDFVAVSCADGTLMVGQVTVTHPEPESPERARGLLAEADSAVESGDLEAAVRALREALDLDPCDLEACRKLAETVESLVQARSASADRRAGEGDLEGALRDLQSASEAAPFDRRVFEKLCDIRDRLLAETLSRSESATSEELPEVLAQVRRALPFDPANLRLRERLASLRESMVAKHLADAETALQSGQYAQAADTLEEAAALDASPAVRAMRTRVRSLQSFGEGMALYHAQKYPQAALLFKRALSIDPQNTDAAKYLKYAQNLQNEEGLFDRFSKLE